MRLKFKTMLRLQMEALSLVVNMNPKDAMKLVFMKSTVHAYLRKENQTHKHSYINKNFYYFH